MMEGSPDAQDAVCQNRRKRQPTGEQEERIE